MQFVAAVEEEVAEISTLQEGGKRICINHIFCCEKVLF